MPLDVETDVACHEAVREQDIFRHFALDAFWKVGVDVAKQQSEQPTQLLI